MLEAGPGKTPAATGALPSQRYADGVARGEWNDDPAQHEALRELGLDTLRFNFRGTGASQGTFDNGDGETDDLLAVAAWLRAQRPQHALWLAGFSFGAYVALRACAQLQPAFMLSIAPPVRRSWDFDTLVLPTCPWLVIQGDADEVVDPQAVRAWVEAMPAPPQLVRMPDTSHFFHRKLLDLRGAIKHGVRAYLPATTA